MSGIHGQLGAARPLVRAVLEEVFAPPPSLTPHEWACAHFRLPATSPSPGRYRPEFIPYQAGILDALGDESKREVVFASSAQVSKSTIAEIWIGWSMHQAPCGMLSVWPSEKKFRAWSRTRLNPMIDDVEVLATLFDRSGRRSASDTIAHKEFGVGFLDLLTARSTTDLKSYSAQKAIAEEVDDYEVDVSEQGDPLELLRARMRTFWNGKMYAVSTPTMDGGSRIWSLLERSTWNEYWVPCPHCREFQPLVWRDATPDEYAAGSYRLIYEKDAAGEVIAGSTQYLCAQCAVLIDERHKSAMLLAGEWRARFPGRYIEGFHINTIYSPLVAWDDIARAWERSHHSPASRKTFFNTWLGLPYKEKGTGLNAAGLSARAEDLPEGVDVPDGAGVLTAGADLQGNRIEAVLWAWGEREEGWALEWARFDGDPGTMRPWEDLEEWLLRPRVHASGAPVRISACAIDAGFQAEKVHQFCEVRQQRRVFAVVGRAGKGKPILKAPDATKFRKTRRQQRPTHVVGSDSVKDQLFSRLQIEKPGPEYMHFSTRLDPMFYDQLTAEKLVTSYESGYPERVWRPIPGRANEANRCTGYAMAALVALGPTVRRELGLYAKALREWEAPPVTAVGPAQSSTPGYGMVSRGIDW